MYIYFLMTTIIGLTFAILGHLMSQGHTNIIHVYHQRNVKSQDKQAYGKAFSKGMYVIAISFFSSGLIALVNASESLCVAVVTFGVMVALTFILKAQNKYNGGVF